MVLPPRYLQYTRYLLKYLGTQLRPKQVSQQPSFNAPRTLPPSRNHGQALIVSISCVGMNCTDWYLGNVCCLACGSVVPLLKQGLSCRLRHSVVIKGQGSSVGGMAPSQRSPRSLIIEALPNLVCSDLTSSRATERV